MSLKLTPALSQEFELVEPDKIWNVGGEPTRVAIRQATNGDDMARNRLFALVAKEYGADDSVKYTSTLSIDDVHCKEAYLVLASCNVETAGGKALIKFKNDKVDMSEFDFADAWGQLPREYAEAIIELIGQVNPHWTPEGKS
jgi:hypothetical protein